MTPSERLPFQIEATSPGTQARAGRIRTLHGEIPTPIFMPVGTRATIKSQTPDSIATLNPPIILANTYHLLQRPGIEVFQKLGGIHRFMNWNGSVLTDSGGFQIFSLPGFRTLDEAGASFTSEVDGRRIHLTPELSIEMQKAIGSDIMMVLDECIPSTSDYARTREAMERTHRWAARSLAARGDSKQALYGIVQGACHEDLRRESAEAISSLALDGFAIGGLAVGETQSQREDFTELTASLLPPDRPRYLMGVGTPIDLLEAVHRGVDQFDCILPTAFGQQGVAFTSRGIVKLKRGVYRFSEEPLDPGCDCSTCTRFTRAYLSHLIKAEELLGWHLVAYHNLQFYMKLMARMRNAILEGRFPELYRELQPVLNVNDLENPVTVPVRSRAPKRERRTLGKYEIVANAAGTHSLKHLPSGEIMHSVSDPSVEAHRLYIEQSRLTERLTGAGQLVIWDVGLGSGTNAMAAIRAIESAASSVPPGTPLRNIRIVSFENDLDSLRLTLKHPSLFPHVRHRAPGFLLNQGYWDSPDLPLRWTLLEGDFLAKLDLAPVPDLIFYDPFSYKTDGPLWKLETFQRIRTRIGERPSELFTYTTSTAVRGALLAAGFQVARGASTGPKNDTTIALTGKARPGADLLGTEWLERWKRSDARRPELDEAIRAHEQFLSRTNMPFNPS